MPPEAGVLLDDPPSQRGAEALYVEMLAIVAPEQQQVERAARLFTIADALGDRGQLSPAAWGGRLP